MKPDLYELLPNVVLFVAVAEARSFSLASKKLGMPVSTLSRKIAEFEEKLGIQLLARSTRKIELTEAGARYLERCQLVVDTAEAAQAELRGNLDEPRGNLRISSTQDFALTYVTPMLAGFAARYPAVTFELDLSPRSVDLITEGIDVAIRMGALPDSRLFARRIGSANVALYAAPSYLKRAGAPTTPAALADHDCLRSNRPTDADVRWTLQREDQIETVSVKGRWVANAARFITELAAQGLGIAAIDRTIAQPKVDAGTLVPVLGDWSLPAVPIHALTPSKLLPARTRAFIETLAEQMRAAPSSENARTKRR